MTKYNPTFAVITKIPQWNGKPYVYNEDTIDEDIWVSDGNLYDGFAVGLPCDSEEDLCDKVGGRYYKFVDVDVLEHEKAMEILDKKNAGDKSVTVFHIKGRVFELGEIVILGESGREIDGSQRKPSKWWIAYKEFDTLDEAIECAIKVQNGQVCD